MGKRHQPSSIDKLLPDLQALIGQLRGQGRTIDEIRAKLLELDVDVSRSALGRHVKSMADTRVVMQRSRQLAESLVKEFGAEPDDKLARLNLELAHGLLMRIMLSMSPDPETGEMMPITLSPEDAMFVARSIQSLSSAGVNIDKRIEAAEERGAKKATKLAAENATRAARAKGLSKDTVEAIRMAVLGSDQ